MRPYIQLIALLVALAAGASAPNREALWQHRNLGKAYYEDPAGAQKAVDEFAKAVALAPDSFRERLNYGLALLHAGNLDGAIEQLKIAQKLEPAMPHTWFNLGIAYKRAGRAGEAIEQFERMVKLVPGEAISHYNLGLLYSRQERNADALRELEEAARLNPRLVAPRFQIYNVHRLAERKPEAARALADFQRARNEMKAADEEEDPEWSWYSEIYDVTEPADASGAVLAALRFEDRALDGKADAATAGAMALDTGGGKPDLLVWSKNGAALYREGARLVAPSGLEGLKDVVHIAAGDWDNDGIPDLCVVTASGARLFRGAGGTLTPANVTLPPGAFTRALWVDFDHDYDLDLFLFGPQPVLLRNQGDGTFQPHTFPFIAGTVVDAMPFRLTPETKGIDMVVSYEGRQTVLYHDLLRGEYEGKPLSGLPAGVKLTGAVDANGDGWLDVVTSEGLWLNRRGTLEAVPGPPGVLGAADPGNRGATDLMTRTGLARNEGGRFGSPRPASGLAHPGAIAEADFNGDGLPDFAGTAADGSVHLWLNRTTTSNSWLAVALTGVKNPKVATGTTVEVKAGPAYQKKIYAGVPLVLGLGERRSVDTLRLTWPNGNIQNQVQPEPGRLWTLKEAPRLSGSCPMIFTWNGREFQFITDVLGVAPLGAGSGDGEVFAVDHDEYVSIPGEALTAGRNGFLPVRMTEELREVSYIDQVRLLALDHPAGVAVLTNEKFKSPPFPEFRLYGIRRAVAPLAARDERGRDVLDAVLRRDGHYADTFEHDLAGMAKPHALTLDFGRGAAKDDRALLVLTGWVDWADGSTFVGASQHGAGHFPRLQVRDARGAWRTVIPDMGMPAGKPKTIVVDLTGKFLSASRGVRILTDLCVYWDEIYLSEDTATPPYRLTPLPAAGADLRFRGFSEAHIDPLRRQPERFVYARLAAPPWNPVPGRYTRYGDVRGLLERVDNRLAVFGSGDEVAFEFDPRALPPLPAGWRRDYLLLVDGWAKDSDANTAFSQSVTPLPFHGMPGYPYGPGERFPGPFDSLTRPSRMLMERLAP